MKKRCFSYAAIVALFLLPLIIGCGSSGSKESTGTEASVSAVSEAACAQCHGSSYNSVSGQPIYAGYVQTKHFNNTIGEVVGCQDCHGGGAQHNGVGPIPYPDPDASGKCFGCHQPAFLGVYNTGGVPTAIQKAHYYDTAANVADAVAPAMYVTKNFEKDCTACHEPHNPIEGIGKQQRKDWAEAGHGDVNGAAWADEDFKTASTSCIRCHTSTGYVNYVSSGYTLPTALWATAGDKGREVLTCKACHNNDSFSVRAASAFTAPYNGGASPAVFPDADVSNLCIACHSGRESGDTINALTSLTNVSFKNPHYAAAAGTMYVKTGFKTLAAASDAAQTCSSSGCTNTTYGATLTSSDEGGKITSTHRKFGSTAMIGDHGITADDTTMLSGGPCTTCHMANNRHTWSAIDANAFNSVCIKCHDEEGGVPLTADNFGELFIEEQALPFNNALAVALNRLLARFSISYDPATYPYFFDELLPLVDGKKQAVKDWTRGKTTGGNPDHAFGKKVMGACFNIQLFKKEPAAYVHARTFARRLIYDTIDFLDNDTIDRSVAATVQTIDPTNYGASAPADASVATESYKYLRGYNRTSFAWYAYPRP